MSFSAVLYVADAETAASGGTTYGPLVRGELPVVAQVADRDGVSRSGLVEALGLIAAGEASVLLTTRLRTVAGSLRELIALVAWLEAVDGALVATDVQLDTSTAGGRRMVALLREVASWDGGQPGGPRRGRPGLAAHAPELSERIRAMRERDLSLQAIADALNADGLPTPRGGAEWRPSSVQAALGYRRPPPPPPGAPLPPQPPPRPPARAPRRAKGGPLAPPRPRGPGRRP